MSKDSDFDGNVIACTQIKVGMLDNCNVCSECQCITDPVSSGEYSPGVSLTDRYVSHVKVSEECFNECHTDP